MPKIKETLIVLLVATLSVGSVLADAKRPQLDKKSDASFKHAIELLEGYRGQQSELEVAHVELNKVLEKYPRYAPAYREMSRYYIAQGFLIGRQFEPGALEAAEMALNKALEIEPNYAEAYVLRGHLYRLLGRYDDAVTALETAEKLGTNDPWLNCNWAALLMDKRQYDEAIRRYQLATTQKGANRKVKLAAYEGLARYYEKIGNHEKVEATYTELISAEPDYAWGYGNYARFLLCQKDDFDRSIAMARQALQIMSYGNGRFWLAAGLYRKWASIVIANGGEGGEEYFAEAYKVHDDLNQVAANYRSCAPLHSIPVAVAMRDSKHTPPPNMNP